LHLLMMWFEVNAGKDYVLFELKIFGKA